MPWYRVTYQLSILDDLQTTDQGMAQRLLDKTKWLASNVANLRHEPLDDDLPGLVQYAVGDWRILYSIDQDEHVVHIHRIATRRELYANRTAHQDS
ncbi:MAG: type II toxin-antitoxin system RelE/ParE family toxin [Nitrospiraceae bacterium]|nr:type II toxin-antitoxin system RelE/ParE family toxin [Nitrospira sp.]MCA9456730.1 type II toxin-antitoxin system RelE/ParE family toxin [Nitrospira sp.]MCB9775817.1 type II toxin-antitoxin system RelE/ParE family toxin [Nitrospiraceae bacterium]